MYDVWGSNFEVPLWKPLNDESVIKRCDSGIKKIDEQDTGGDMRNIQLYTY